MGAFSKAAPEHKSSTKRDSLRRPAHITFCNGERTRPRVRRLTPSSTAPGRATAPDSTRGGTARPARKAQMGRPRGRACSPKPGCKEWRCVPRSPRDCDTLATSRRGGFVAPVSGSMRAKVPREFPPNPAALAVNSRASKFAWAARYRLRWSAPRILRPPRYPCRLQNCWPCGWPEKPRRRLTHRRHQTVSSACGPRLLPCARWASHRR